MDVSDIIAGLREIRTTFDDSARRRRHDLCLRLTESVLMSAARVPRKLLSELHELLLFAAAYPDDSDTARSVDKALAALREITTLDRSRNGQLAERIGNSGIVGASNRASFSLDLCRWLVERLGDRVEIDWQDGTAGEDLEAVLPIIVARTSADGLLDDSLTTQAWIERARGAAGPRRDRRAKQTRFRANSDLAWLLEQFATLDAPATIVDRIWERLELPVRWTLRDTEARTFSRFPARPAYFQRAALVRHLESGVKLTMPIPHVRPLPETRAMELIETARFALAARQRETDPITYANPREVTLFQLDRGIDVALFGMTPGRRLPIESFFGFVAARNRVPCAYGGGWVFFDRCEIGVNIFDTFRGGESAFLFTRIMQVYQRHFRARRFTVDPFQFGKDNEEAIASGAYWFYYRLGFRSSEAHVRALADAEAAHIAADRKYRSPAKTLRRLAGSNLVLSFGDAGTSSADVSLTGLSLAATNWIGEQFGGDRVTAEFWSSERIRKLAGLRGVERKRADDDEARTARELSPLVAMLPDLATWPRSEIRAGVEVLSMKSAPRERDYALALQRHAHLRRAWAAL